MEFVVKNARPETLKTATLVVAVGEGGALDAAASAVDAATSGALSAPSSAATSPARPARPCC